MVLKKLIHLYLYFFIANICLSCAHAAPVVGNGTQGLSFSFPIAAHVYHPTTGLLYVGARQAPSADAASYAISVSGPVINQFLPLVTAQRATVNGVQMETNPLRGAAVQLLGLLGNDLIVLLSLEPSSIYLVQDSRKDPLVLLKASNILDALGAPTTGVLAVASNVLASDTGLSQGMAIFAAVQSEGIFGRAGGGIAVVRVVESSNKTFELRYLATSLLNTTTQAVKIGNDLAAMDNAVSLHMDKLGVVHIQSGEQVQNLQLRELFIGLQVTAGPSSSDGAHALIGALATAQAPIFFKLAPDSAITSDSIIAAKGAGVQVSAHHVAVTTTTTALKYLVLVGGVGDPFVTQRTVYALPLVSASGLLAKVQEAPQTEFSTTAPFLFKSRAFVHHAVHAGDLYRSTDIQARVGGGALPAAVTELCVVGDAVFAAVGIGDHGEQPGIFYSTALFDALGRIKGWTRWQRAATGQIWGMALDQRTGNFWYFTGTDARSVFTVNRTACMAGTAGVAGAINSMFEKTSGQVQALFDFPSSTVGFDQGKKFSMHIATKYQQVAMVQAGKETAGLFGPVTDFSNIYSSEDGTLHNFVPGVCALSMKGGALNQLGAIIAATVVTDGTYGWFVVAGSAGVAVLSRDDGTGWLLDPGMQDGFAGLTPDMHWRIVGNYQAVRKLMSDPESHLLYVLTNDRLERLEISPKLFATGVSGLLLAHAEKLLHGKHKFFSDMLISRYFALLATSSGLMRIANGLDIRTVSSQTMKWVPVILHESSGPVTRLFGISPTGQAHQLIQPDLSGNLYVLQSYVGRHQARIYRFTYHDTHQVTDETLVQLPDFLMRDENTFFINIGDYRNFITTDGALMALSRSRYGAAAPFVEILAPEWRQRAFNTPVNQSYKITQTAGHHIGQMIRSSASGSWLIPHDLGIFVQE